MILSKRVALAIAGVAAATAVGTAGVAAATAPDPSGSPAPSPTASAPDSGTGAPGRAAQRRARFGHRVLGRGLHGEFVVRGKDGAYVTVATVRGEVTAVSASSITVKAQDGYTATYAVTAETKVRGKDVDTMADVKVGDRGGVVGTKNGGTLTARAVLVRR